MFTKTLVFLAITAIFVQFAVAENPDKVLSKLTPQMRDWVNRSCSRSLGPSLWSNCVIRESSAASTGKPDLSGLKPDFREWVIRSCPDTLGPSLTINCLNREKAAILGGLPDVSSLTPEQKQWVLNSCPTTLGPSLFVGCVKRETAALRGVQSAPKTLQPTPSPIPRQNYNIPRTHTVPDSYVIEIAHNDDLFIINGERFEAQTYCLGWEKGDRVLFLEGSPFGACASAELYNLRTREKCSVWCE